MMKLFMWISFIIFVAGVCSIQAQNKNKHQQQPPNKNKVIDLGATEVKIKIETPHVQILTQRIKPKFDDVKIDRSFRKELIGEDEKINLKQRSGNAEYIRINVEQLMKKLR